MGSRYEVEVTLSSAKDLKNINWQNGPIRPYVVAWVDRDRKVTSRVVEEGDTSPQWNQTLTVPLYGPVKDATLYFDVVHHTSPDEEDTEHLIGSEKLDLRDVVEKVGIGAPHACSLEFKRPSGGPSEKLKLWITIRELQYHSYTPPLPHHTGKGGGSQEPAPYGDPGYGQPVHGHRPGYKETEKRKRGFQGMDKEVAIGAVVKGVSAAFDAIKKGVEKEAAKEVKDDAGYPKPHHAGKGGESRDMHPYGQPPMAYRWQPAPYGDRGYGQRAYGHRHGYEEEEEKKKSRFGGMGKGLAIGAATGILGGIAAGAVYASTTAEARKKAAEARKKAAEEVKDEAGG